jgi:hypothetical protein
VQSLDFYPQAGTAFPSLLTPNHPIYSQIHHAEHENRQGEAVAKPRYRTLRFQWMHRLRVGRVKLYADGSRRWGEAGSLCLLLAPSA